MATHTQAVCWLGFGTWLRLLLAVALVVLLWSENFEVGKVVVVFVAVDVVPRKGPPILRNPRRFSRPIWVPLVLHLLQLPPACPFVFHRLPFHPLLRRPPVLLRLFLLPPLPPLLPPRQSSSSSSPPPSASSLHCLFPAVTGMLKVAKMLRMQRACALTFYSNNYPVFHVSRASTVL